MLKFQNLGLPNLGFIQLSKYQPKHSYNGYDFQWYDHLCLLQTLFMQFSRNFEFYWQIHGFKVPPTYPESKPPTYPNEYFYLLIQGLLLFSSIQSGKSTFMYTFLGIKNNFSEILLLALLSGKLKIASNGPWSWVTYKFTPAGACKKYF